MNTLLLLLLSLLAVSPLLKKLFDRLNLDVAEKQYSLLKKAVEDAVSHVAQISNEETPPEKKKEKAIEIGTKIASQLGVTEARIELVSDLIESVLWKDGVDENDENDEDDEF